MDNAQMDFLLRDHSKSMSLVIGEWGGEEGQQKKWQKLAVG